MPHPYRVSDRVGFQFKPFPGCPILIAKRLGGNWMEVTFVRDHRISSQFAACSRIYDGSVSPSPIRYHNSGKSHFITFSCHQRRPLLNTPESRRAFELVLERARHWYGFFISGYVVMPEHIHILISEPERKSLSVALQMLKQTVARQLRTPGGAEHFWQPRYYDFDVWSSEKHIEKLRLTFIRIRSNAGWPRALRTGSGAASVITRPGWKGSSRSNPNGRRENESDPESLQSWGLVHAQVNPPYAAHKGGAS